MGEDGREGIMSEPTITITLTNTNSQFFWDVTIGKETFRMSYHGGTIESKHGRYFFDTPYYGVTQTQNVYKMTEVPYKFSEVK